MNTPPASRFASAVSAQRPPTTHARPSAPATGGQSPGVAAARALAALFALAFGAVPLQAQREPLAVAPVTASTPLLEAARENDTLNALARISESLEARLGNALQATGKFTITARRELPAILDEQVLADSGNLAPESAARAFELTGARYLLVVGIDDFQDYTESSTFAQVDRTVQRRQVRMGTVARIFDTTSGTLLEATTVSLEESDTRQEFSGARREGDRTEAIYTQLAEAAAREIAQTLSHALFPPRVIAKTGNQITLNLGDGSGVQRGQRFALFAIGEVMTDPDTGEALGREEVLLGEAEIIHINPRTSQARLLEDNGVERGHVARPLR